MYIGKPTLVLLPSSANSASAAATAGLALTAKMTRPPTSRKALRSEAQGTKASERPHLLVV